VFSDPPPLPSAEFWKLFVPSLTGVVGFWATLSLNIPDFSRYAKSQRSQILGQSLGLPSTMTLYAFIGIAVTQATVVIFGEPIWDPVLLFQRFESGSIVVIAMIGLALATLSTNIAANVVSPANDLANLAPKYISFRTGGLITAVVGVVIMPWKLIESTQGYVFTWLIAYGGLLGPIAGIMIADYFIVRRGELKVDALYDPHGAYRYWGGFNPVALGSLLAAVLPNIPGFVNAATGRAVFPGIFDSLYVWAWFMGFFLALIVYPVLMSIFHSGNGGRASAAPTP
jgi:NCS1 family nucleobase:cation symporter-1